LVLALPQVALVGSAGSAAELDFLVAAFPGCPVAKVLARVEDIPTPPEVTVLA
jgi:hypothetical protein